MWYELHIDMGEEGTRTISTHDTKEEAIKAKKEYIDNDNKFPVFIDKWNENGPIEE